MIGSIHGGTFDHPDVFSQESPTLQRIDNITDAALLRFRAEYQDEDIQKDDIFNYVYGILHSPRYRDRFKNDLSKGLPRIPFAPDFDAFAGAGSALSELHLRYDDENLTRYPLKVVSSTGRDLEAGDFRLGKRRMRFADKTKRDTLIVNDQVRLFGIPKEAHRYVVGGRTPLEWFIFYFFVKTDKRSGIVNDANGWFEDPRDLVPAIERLVYVSVESARIVDSLPDPFGDVHNA